MKFIFTHPAYLQRIRDTFVYEGHRVKIKVTLAKKVPQCKKTPIGFYKTQSYEVCVHHGGLSRDSK